MDNHSYKILVIEDEKPLSHALEIRFTNEGYTVTVANDGQAALDIISTEHYDVALLDLMMPVMDGFQVLQRAMKLPTPPQFLVLSNITQPDDIDKALQYGAKKFLVKSDTTLASIVYEVEQLLK
jgi:two-component system response regulator VicR